ncbi:MAG: hypothetical protein GC129_01700 [Proteobacteria bacterium]|nr:hypothetical protein [Pseudomonadota bacterium]
MRPLRPRYPATLLPLLLAACGYTPLYAPGKGAAEAPTQIQIGTVEMEKAAINVGQRRPAQVVSQQLQLDYPNQGSGMDTANVTIEESTSTLAMQQTSALQRAQINLTGKLFIVDAGGKPLLRADMSTSAAYNVEDTPYSTESGKTFARLTAARTLAEELSRRIALFYRTRQLQPVNVEPEVSPTLAPHTVSMTIPLPFKP